jgi:hypothetical protein
LKNLFITFFLICISSFSSANEIAADDLDSSINTLKSSIADIYSFAKVLKILEAPKNRKVVFFSVTGFYKGNNSYTYLAVFEKSQKSINIQGETYEYFGNIHFRLIGYIQVGGHLFGNLDLANVKIENDTVKVPINYNGSYLLMLNGEILQKLSPMLNVKINSFGLSFSL